MRKAMLEAEQKYFGLSRDENLDQFKDENSD